MKQLLEVLIKNLRQDLAGVAFVFLQEAQVDQSLQKKSIVRHA